MNRILKRITWSVCLTIIFQSAFAQEDNKRYSVAVFTPLYLDSAFDQSPAYRYGKSFPKFFNAGLEFYEGVQWAADSLKKEGLALDIHIYDTRSAKSSVNEIIKSEAFDQIDLVIGHVNAAETRQLANAVAKNNIPFINVTHPNDAGVSNNPNFIILNSTLNTHCAAIYRFIQKNHALAPVVVFRKKGIQEDKLKTTFDDITKSTASVPLKIKYVTLETNFTPEDLKKHLDTERTTVCIAGSLDVNFGLQLTQHLATLYLQYPFTIFAMPTWWDITNFSKPEYKGIEFFYTTPFFLAPTNKLGVAINNDFKTRFFSRPTDMIFRGYESLYHFAHLLNKNGRNLGSSLSDKSFQVFTSFDIKPVLNPKTMTLDYFENKNIYMIKKVDTTVTAVN